MLGESKFIIPYIYVRLIDCNNHTIVSNFHLIVQTVLRTVQYFYVILRIIESLDELTCLKRELKAWESMFERKHARKPSKVILRPVQTKPTCWSNITQHCWMQQCCTMLASFEQAFKNISIYYYSTKIVYQSEVTFVA